MRAEIAVTGIVQGVGFRPFVYRTAVENHLMGYVQNRADAGVKIVIEGDEADVKSFIEDLKSKKPPIARIYTLNVKHDKDRNEFKDFRIIKSSNDAELQGSIIPPDVSICDQCLRELRDPNNRRFEYFFITCTDCGPRYTTITGLPYDRPNTTMIDFPMCDDCAKEYREPSDRRFHAQTIACHKCGPKVLLVSSSGLTTACTRCDPTLFLRDGEEKSDYRDPIREAAKLLQEGYILAVRGNGGFHIATSTLNSEPIARLRKKKYRGNKPFAIMARDLEAVKSFAEITPEEEEILTSYIKPIVLLKKRKDYYLSDLIAPGLDRIGVMLPYTALHAMLFDGIKEPAFIMTSANPPYEPIVTENEEAIAKLGHFVDFFLLHNRGIAQRADDSVLRMHGKDLSIIRRSRGFAPEPIHLKRSSEKCILGLGAELNVTSCILANDKAVISQYIGDVEKFETLEFLRSATEHLIRLTNSKIDLVACDLHPTFNTSSLAAEFSDLFGCPVIKVQHHYAHMASLMGEHGLDSLMGIACDGYGYGSDDSAWGGEILHCSNGAFERVAHLEPQLLVGGDLATRHPLRMVAGILKDHRRIHDWLSERAKYFPHGEKEVGIVLKQLQSGKTPRTTSCGRVLDAVSALLDICHERTYEGEPAMRLESVAAGGKDVLDLKPRIHKGVLETTHLLEELFENLGNHSTTDLACSAQTYMAKGVAELAVTNAKREGVDCIGFSGGVAHNEFLTNAIRSVVQGSGLQFYVNKRVPPGDGGISLGQVIAGSKVIEEEIEAELGVEIR